MTKDKNVHAGHRQRMKETYLRSEFDNFSEVERLEFLLFFACPQKDTNLLAHKLLKEFGSLEDVVHAPVDALMSISGIGEHAAIFLNSLGTVIESYGSHSREITLSSTSIAKQYTQRMLLGRKEEGFAVVCLDAQNRVMARKVLAVGTAHSVNASIRDITNYCIACKSERIVVAHNHPAGECSPSDPDIAFTRALVCSCLLNDIKVLDHIIITDIDAYSMVEHQIMSAIEESAFEAVTKEYDMQKLAQPQAEYKNDALDA